MMGHHQLGKKSHTLCEIGNSFHSLKPGLYHKVYFCNQKITLNYVLIRVKLNELGAAESRLQLIRSAVKLRARAAQSAGRTEKARGRVSRARGEAGFMLVFSALARTPGL